MKFDQKYNHDAFATFLRDFLPEDYVENEKDIADLSRCKIITHAKELGHSPALNVYVLEMNHAKETDPRVSIATDAFKLLATFGYDKALVIFKNDESENYRFSYLTISLDLNDKNKVVAKYSNARRYSFYLGEGAKTKTPEQQLVKRGRVKDTNDLLSRFSLEVVNKQFYLEIAKFFDELVDEQDANLALPFQSDATVRKNFAMRLIGRIMFCWFLKQKKSKDGALVSDELLSAQAVKDGYYHSTLEPLFFEILNTQIDERDIRSDVYDKVPYLNGGLFSPQNDDYYDLDRGTFTSRHINTLRVSDAWFSDFFALLETYNFTIDENTVFDQELSVDPEMLGRIFENLLAEINPETGSSERKRTGSYYTPRQVVEYMVDQSLTEYLKTESGIEGKRLAALVSYDLGDDEGNQLTDDENKKIVKAIEALKILDPACGSGAFPIGALQKIVWILQRIDPLCDLWLGRKLEQVPELYRKKITDYFHNNPPDYIRKLDVIKNSIFGVDIQPIAVEMSRLRCFLTLVVESEIDDAKKNRGIEPLPNLDFKFVCANTLVGLPKKGSNGLFEDHAGIEALSSIMSEYFTANRTERALIKNRFYNKQKELLNRMIERRAVGDLTLKLTNWEPFENKPSGWFDPEWMFGIGEKFDVVIGNPPYVSVKKISVADKEIFAENLETAKGRFNLFTLFLERGHKLLKNRGVLSYILPEVLYTNTEYRHIRKYLLDRVHILSISNFSQRVFEAAVDTSVIILKNEYDAEAEIRVLLDLNQPVAIVKQSSIEDIIPTKTSEDIESLLRKIRLGKEKLGNIIEVQQGIIYSGQKKEDVFANELVDESYKKILDGRDIQRYFINYDAKKENRYIKYTRELHRPREERLFLAQEKIVFPRRSTSFVCALDTEQFYLLNTAYICLVKDAKYNPKYLTGILNSKLINFFYQNTYIGWQITIPAINAIPIPKITAQNKKIVDSLIGQVDKIISAHEHKSGTITDIEREIDRLVFELYELTADEVAAITG